MVNKCIPFTQGHIGACLIKMHTFSSMIRKRTRLNIPPFKPRTCLIISMLALGDRRTVSGVKRLTVHHYSAGYILFPLGSLSPACLSNPLKPALVGAGWGAGSVCNLANYSIAYDETQSNRVSEFRYFVCSLF